MAVPKQKSSKGRTRRRRANKNLKALDSVKCSHCGKPTLAHRVCPNCGFYKDREIVDVLKKLESSKAHKARK